MLSYDMLIFGSKRFTRIGSCIFTTEQLFCCSKLQFSLSVQPLRTDREKRERFTLSGDKSNIGKARRQPMKEKRKSKWLSLLLAGIMVLTLFPGMAMAEERAEGEGTQTICTLTEGCTLPDGHDGVCVANNAGKGENEETKERQGTKSEAKRS